MKKLSDLYEKTVLGSPSETGHELFCSLVGNTGVQALFSGKKFRNKENRTGKWVPFSSLLDSYFKQTDIYKNMKIISLKDKLGDFLGEQYAKRLKIDKFSDGVLYFTTDTKDTLSNIRFIIPKWKEKINVHLGEELVSDIIVRIDKKFYG